MPGGKGNIKPEDGKQFSSEYQPKQKWTEDVALKFGEDMIDWLTAVDENGKDLGNVLFEEFVVIVKGKYPDLLNYLCKKFTSFSDLHSKAKKIQELKLVKYALVEKVNVNMAKFVLNVNHGMNEKTQIEHSGSLKGFMPEGFEEE